MSNVVIYDEATNQVKRYLKSVNTPEYVGRTDVVIFDKSNPPSNLDILTNIPIQYWKHNNGSIVEMTTAEKTAIDDEELAQAIIDKRNEANQKLITDEGQLTRAFVEIVMNEINILRAEHSLPPRTLKQLKNAIKKKIDDGNAD